MVVTSKVPQWNFLATLVHHVHVLNRVSALVPSSSKVPRIIAAPATEVAGLRLIKRIGTTVNLRPIRLTIPIGVLQGRVGAMHIRLITVQQPIAITIEAAIRTTAHKKQTHA